MAYNRYRGNSGRVERVEDVRSPAPPVAETPPPPPEPPRPGPPPPPGGRPVRPPGRRSPPSAPLPGLGGELGRLLERFLSPERMETEDILLLLILYLLYRESGDRDFLIMIGGLLLF